jgi:hypothetical protein
LPRFQTTSIGQPSGTQYGYPSRSRQPGGGRVDPGGLGELAGALTPLSPRGESPQGSLTHRPGPLSMCAQSDLSHPRNVQTLPTVYGCDRRILFGRVRAERDGLVVDVEAERPAGLVARILTAAFRADDGRTVSGGMSRAIIAARAFAVETRRHTLRQGGLPKCAAWSLFFRSDPGRVSPRRWASNIGLEDAEATSFYRCITRHHGSPSSQRSARASRRSSQWRPPTRCGSSRARSSTSARATGSACSTSSGRGGGVT